MTAPGESWSDRVAAACADRQSYVDTEHVAAFRLFDGAVPPAGRMVLDVYGETLVVHDHRSRPDAAVDVIVQSVDRVRSAWPWLRAAVWKQKSAMHEADRRGRVVFGSREQVADRVLENGVHFAVDLCLNQDTSFYLDTRSLRAWAKSELAGAHVLNTFAYTGSLGVAARAAPAARVVHVDRNRSFLAIAQRSYELNGFGIRTADFVACDVFPAIARMKREHRLFDAVFLDPPFFSLTRAGRVDLERDFVGLVNKVRPVVGDGGRLVLVNNALYVSGESFSKTLQGLCADGYLHVERHIDVPDDVVDPRMSHARTASPVRAGSATSPWPEDPAPWRHPTKIAVLRVCRKDGRTARDAIAG